MKVTDAAITYRILKLLCTPFEKSKAYQMGLVDAKGNPLKKSSEMTSEEKNVYTILVRLVFRLKRLIEKTPVKNKEFVSYAAALALIKECVAANHEPISLESMFLEACNADELDISAVESFINMKGHLSFALYREDAAVVAANSTANVVGTGDDNQTVVPKKKKDTVILKRNKQ